MVYIKSSWKNCHLLIFLVGVEAPNRSFSDKNLSTRQFLDYLIWDEKPHTRKRLCDLPSVYSALDWKSRFWDPLPIIWIASKDFDREVEAVHKDVSRRWLPLLLWSHCPGNPRRRAQFLLQLTSLPWAMFHPRCCLPSTTQLRHETIRWLSSTNYNDAAYCVLLCVRYSFTHIILLMIALSQLSLPLFHWWRSRFQKGHHLTWCIEKAQEKREDK